MPDPAVETDDLRKRYPRVEALAGVTLRIERGEIFALLGPNGAGKTTWISIVCGLSRPSAGRARVLGHDVVSEPIAARRRIGLVPQEINFDPFFTPREALRFQMGYYGVEPDARRIDEVLGALDLLSKADANARELSGGMKRRLLIAKALVHRPPVVFLDEPTAGVDVALRRELWQYVRALRAGGTTIVLTTHYLEEAEELADRVAVIDHGRLVCLDRPAALVARFGKRRLRFTFRAPLPEGAIGPALRALGATPGDGGTTLTCDAPAGDMAELMAAIASLPAPLADVDVERPTLEQVFLTLTGHGAGAPAAEAP